MKTQQTITERFDDDSNAMVDHITAATDYAEASLHELYYSHPLAHQCLEDEISEELGIAENRKKTWRARIDAADKITGIVSRMMENPQCDDLFQLDD